MALGLSLAIKSRMIVPKAQQTGEKYSCQMTALTKPKHYTCEIETFTYFMYSQCMYFAAMEPTSIEDHVICQGRCWHVLILHLTSHPVRIMNNMNQYPQVKIYVLGMVLIKN